MDDYVRIGEIESAVEPTVDPLGAAWMELQDWNSIVDKYQGMLFGVSRRDGLIEADAEDSVQTTWLRLLERHDQIRDPSRIAGWLKAVVHHDSILRSQRRNRETPSPLDGAFNIRGDADVEDQVLDRSMQQIAEPLRRAINRLSEKDQQLISLLFGIDREPVSHTETASQAGRPLGSIGPTRARILSKLRKYVTDEGLNPSDIF